MRAARRKAVVTGVGTICGLGPGRDAFWSGLCEGRSAIAPIGDFDASGFRCTVASALPRSAFDVLSVVPKSYRKATKVMARDIELAVGAAHAAVLDAKLATKGSAESSPPSINPDRFGCHIGAGLIAADVDELSAALASSAAADGTFDIGAWGREGMQNLTPLWLLKYLPNMLACHVTIIHDCRGPSNTITCAEPSGLLSLGESLRVIERGAADACLTGGAESKLNPMGLLRQQFAGRLAAVAAGADHERAVRPFDADADGSVLGEGGGILVLEAEETAMARSATALARLDGFAAGQCACEDTLGMDLRSAGEDIAAVLDAALADAGCSAGEVDAIVPLGSGIRSLDLAEEDAIVRVFGSKAPGVPIITLTPNVGICGAGAGALALAAAALALSTQRLPARRSAAGSARLDSAACPARDAALHRIAVVTPGLGGQVAAAIFGRCA